VAKASMKAIKEAHLTTEVGNRQQVIPKQNCG